MNSADDPSPSDESREGIVHLLELMDEQARRLRASQSAYAANDGQRPVHKCTKQTRLVLSGNGAGKTALATNEAVWAALGFNPELQEFTPVPARVVVVIDHPSKSDDVWVPEIRKWHDTAKWRFQKRGTHHITAIVFPNGSEIVFFSHAMDPLAFESIELDMMICDEPPPRHVYIGLFRGGRKKGRKLKVLIVGTPITGSWLRREVYDPWSKNAAPDTECFRFGTAVNAANLTDGYVESFGSKLSEKEKRVRLEGEFFDLDGLALAHLFNREVHVIEAPDEGWPSDLPCVIVIDPHPVKEHVAIILSVDKDGFLYYVKETSKKLPARRFFEHIREWSRGHRIVNVICDSIGNTDGSGGEGFKSFVQVGNEVMGTGRVRVTSWDEKSDEDFIERIRDALLIPAEPDNLGNCVPKLRILEGNPGIIGNIESAQWVRVRAGQEYKPKLDISYLDYLACLKYGLACNLTPGGSRVRMYSIGKKEGLYNLPRAPKGRSAAVTLKVKRADKGTSRRRGRGDEGWNEF